MYIAILDFVLCIFVLRRDQEEYGRKQCFEWNTVWLYPGDISKQDSRRYKSVRPATELRKRSRYRLIL